MIVFLHGWGMQKDIFKPFVDSYLSAKDVLLLSLPGYEEGVWLEDFDAQVKQLAKKIPNDTHLIAWSLGGLYALRLATLYPDKFTRITMVCSTPCFAQRVDFKNALNASVLNQFSEQLIDDREKTIDRFLLLQLHGQAQAKELVRTIKNTIIKAIKVKNEVLEHGLGCLKDIDYREDLKKCAVPIQFVLGKRDMIVPYKVARDISFLNAAIKISTIDDAAHIPFVTHEKKFYDLVFK